MPISWIPDPLKQQIVDAVIEFLGKQSEELVGQQLGDKIRSLSSQGSLRKALGDALDRGIERFEQEYADIDEDLTTAILDTPDFWNDRTIQKAILALISKPGIARPDEHEAVVMHFECVLPGRRNRERVDKAVSYLLRLVAEEVWAVPGADEIRQLYALQMQRLSTEALRQQVDLMRANLQVTTQLSTDMRQALFQLADATERRLLAAPTTSTQPQRPRPYLNLPHRSYTRFVGRQAQLQKLHQLLDPRSRHFLVTLDGMGGVGKSALALECAYRYRDTYNTLPADERFEAIVWVSAKRTLLTAGGIQQRRQTFNTLADLYREIAIVLEQPAILQVDAEQRRGLVEHAVTGQRTLLVVDNLETVDDEELLTFLRELPEPTKAIVTTRHRIDIAYAIRLKGMPETDALALMVIEAAQKNVELPVEYANDLYRRTGGIPLAIVWSIGLMSVGHGVEAVLRRLGSGHSDIARFCFTESAAVIRGRDAERLLLALALFDASASRVMLGDVAGLAEDEIGRDDGLAELEQLSLVNKEGDRFSLLPLTRAFALEELARQPELEEELRERWIDTLTKFAEPYVHQDWRWRDMPLLRSEGSHLITLAKWARHAERVDVYLAVVPALVSYYATTGQWADLISIGRSGIDIAQLTDYSESRFYIENSLAWVLSQQGHHDEAERIAYRALEAAREQNDISWQLDLTQICSQVLRRRGAYDAATELCQHALPLISLLSSEQQPYIRANLEYELGKIARDRQDWETARRHFLAARTVFSEEVNNPSFNLEWAWGLLSNLGLVTQNLGDLESAAEMYTRSLQFFRQSGEIGNIATALTRLASLEERRGNHNAARNYAREVLDLCQRLGLVHERVQAEAILQRLGG